ncbi:hypothetical protein PAPYR_3882 [Paratrimastix pyriformis]|uniref:Uncharacterized protein n=1 Tax=Paratrimastix pyriformis TaxID=342808 RepID=A0ABQ8UR20_9EUKA|nr:hypothetical protein PAPYR_3882 [Paratrimastix pyriformis]
MSLSSQFAVIYSVGSASTNGFSGKQPREPLQHVLCVKQESVKRSWFLFMVGAVSNAIRERPTYLNDLAPRGHPNHPANSIWPHHQVGLVPLASTMFSPLAGLLWVAGLDTAAAGSPQAVEEARRKALFRRLTVFLLFMVFFLMMRLI